MPCSPEYIEKHKLKLRSLIREGRLVGHANKIDMEYGKIPSLVRLSAASLLKNSSSEEVVQLCESGHLPLHLAEILKGETAYPLPLAEIKDFNERLVASSPMLAEVPLTEADLKMIGFFERGEYHHLLGSSTSTLLVGASSLFSEPGGRRGLNYENNSGNVIPFGLIS